MKKSLFATATILSALLFVACGGGEAQKQSLPTMQTSADSMSYVLGMNIGRNLIVADSMINVEMVCQGIRDVYSGEPKFTDEEARMAYMKYMNYDNYERIKAFESQFLEEIRRGDRKFVATTSGLTYKVTDVGDLRSVVRNNRDTMLVRYRMLNMAGEVVDTTYLHGDTLRIAAGDVPKGVLEATKLIGKGGHIEAWLPSPLGFGAEGCDSLGVGPNTILYYELWLVDVEKR
ncbi:MAG: peptidylprolyl isomerase [Alistipes sp.]|nr:peptidylprolyl isomerase [Alistipes sp.]